MYENPFLTEENRHQTIAMLRFVLPDLKLLCVQGFGENYSKTFNKLEKLQECPVEDPDRVIVKEEVSEKVVEVIAAPVAVVKKAKKQKPGLVKTSTFVT